MIRCRHFRRTVRVFIGIWGIGFLVVIVVRAGLLTVVSHDGGSLLRILPAGGVVIVGYGCWWYGISTYVDRKMGNRLGRKSRTKDWFAVGPLKWSSLLIRWSYYSKAKKYFAGKEGLGWWWVEGRSWWRMKEWNSKMPSMNSSSSRRRRREHKMFVDFSTTGFNLGKQQACGMISIGRHSSGIKSSWHCTSDTKPQVVDATTATRRRGGWHGRPEIEA
jgi:hypothetical protein